MVKRSLYGFGFCHGPLCKRSGNHKEGSQHSAGPIPYFGWTFDPKPVLGIRSSHQENSVFEKATYFTTKNVTPGGENCFGSGCRGELRGRPERVPQVLFRSLAGSFGLAGRDDRRPGSREGGGVLRRGLFVGRITYIYACMVHKTYSKSSSFVYIYTCIYLQSYTDVYTYIYIYIWIYCVYVCNVM